MDKQASTNKNINDETPSDTILIKKFIRNGYQFEFVDGDNKIECWGSSKSGLEKVSLNGKLVSEKRNLFSRTSTHKFNQGKHVYEVEFNMVSMMRAELHCILIKDGVHFETKKAVPSNFTGKKPFSVVRAVIEGFVLGFLFGAIGFAVAEYVIGLDSVSEGSAELLSLISSVIG